MNDDIEKLLENMRALEAGKPPINEMTEGMREIVIEAIKADTDLAVLLEN